MFTQDIYVTDRTLSALSPETSESAGARAEINMLEVIHRACEQVAPVWPLTNFIAANPLKGYEDRNFFEAVELAEKYFHGRGLPPSSYFHEQFRKGRITTEDIKAVLESTSNSNKQAMVNLFIQQATESPSFSDRERDRVFLLPTEWLDQSLKTRLYSWSQAELTKWCAAYFDLGQAGWRMPKRELGFYQAWMRLAQYDKSFELAGVKGFRRFVATLPASSTEAIEMLCGRLEIPKHLLGDYFARHFAALPGWSGLFRYRGSEKQYMENAEPLAELVDWLAVRIVYDVACTEWASQEVLGVQAKWPQLVEALRARIPEQSGQTRKQQVVSDAGKVWLKALERNYRKQLLANLSQGLNRWGRREPKNKRPLAQGVFCIDVRSEGYRRHLEQLGDYETYGFAGFFAIPLAHKQLGSQDIHAQCPVLLRPKYLIEEVAVGSDAGKVKRFFNRLRSGGELKQVLKEVKSTSLAPFSFVETFGGLSSLGLALRSFVPNLLWSLGRLAGKLFAPAPKSKPQVEVQTKAHPLFTLGIPESDQFAIAENSLRFIGLTKNFGKLVLVCGHGSTTTNNPYASSLDCGACGGHRGAPNARVAAAIFNSPQVRAYLKSVGIDVPEDTWFLAAEHNTTNDVVEILDESSIPARHEGAVAQLKRDLKSAGVRLNMERTRRFDAPATNFDSAFAEVTRRSRDWSEVRPEWGLAGNAAFIIARREITRGLDLQCRTFMHSYRWEEDAEAKALEVIMTAPMIVTQWINSQYYFSSVDNEVFGSGSKAIHNVVGKVGVMQGNISDFKIGLPLQSVSDGENLQHEPMRLLVVIEAPRDRIRNIAEKHDSVRQLVQNEWIRIVAMDPATLNFEYLDPSLSGGMKINQRRTVFAPWTW